MDKKQLAIIILSVATAGILIFMVIDIWNSINDVRRSQKMRLAIQGQTPALQRMQVAASFYPLYFFSQQIAGDKADVVQIIQAGSDPSKYNLTAGNITNIENSKLIILNGLGLESWFTDAQNIVNAKKGFFVDVSKSIDENDLVFDGDHTDYHIWLSAKLADNIIEEILQGFLKADPQNAEFYKSNAESLKSKVQQIDSEFETGLQNCSSKNIFVLSTGFSYMARDYNFGQVSLLEPGQTGQLSQKQQENIADFVKKENVQYIFWESKLSLEATESMEKKIGSKILTINLAEAGDVDYFSAMQENLNNLKTALRCQ